MSVVVTGGRRPEPLHDLANPGVRTEHVRALLAG
ncbi:hypothetical protein EV640_102179 [Nesterenkonia aurantiaca]|uniref:Uncharacterized protein n=1 Tax=Nesterenkonia aurantiaca TaxID=1436010 RepID=A0A4R7G5Y5_9MICC|nr:hypothetical protein EV640_102179 [Nesterenkonia aurantiaca]